MGKLVLLRLFDALWGLISIVPAIMAVGGFYSSRFHPAKHIDIQWLGLFLALILVINILVMLYWIWRKRFWFIFPLFALLLNIPFLSTMFQWPFKTIEPAKREVKIGTYNMQEEQNEDFSAIGEEMRDLLLKEKPAIFCIQQFPQEEAVQGAFIEKISTLLPYYTIHASSPQNMHIALFSRYPIMQSQMIPFQEETRNVSMWADLLVEGDTIRIFNSHLQTTGRNQNRIRPLISIRQTLSRMHRLKKVMNDNWMIRAAQSDIISALIDESPYPLIVCGDFNDTSASYTYRMMKGDLEDSFRSCGRGYAYSYKYLKKLFRIDYVFYSRGLFRGTRYYSPEMKYSDHKPVIVTLDFNPIPPSSVVQNRR